MKNLISTCLIICSQFAFSYSDSLVRVPIGTFIEQNQGQYKILTANGVEPKPDAATASVLRDSETNECILQFPYCHSNGTCDPGYIFFDCGREVLKDTVGDQHENFTLINELNGKTYRYTWDIDHGKVKFTNYQYQLPGGPSISLEYVATKISD